MPSLGSFEKENNEGGPSQDSQVSELIASKPKKRKISSEEMKVFYLEECLLMRRKEHEKRMTILNEIERRVTGKVSGETETQCCTNDIAPGYLEELSFTDL